MKKKMTDQYANMISEACQKSGIKLKDTGDIITIINELLALGAEVGPAIEAILALLEQIAPPAPAPVSK